MTDSLLRVDSSRNRSETRSTSNQHSRRTSSIISPSVRSWVQNIQKNHPPPPDHATTPLRVSHPLPEHSYHSYPVPSQGHLAHRHLQIMNPTETDDEDYYNIDPDQSRLGPSYLAENSGRGQRNAVQLPANLTRDSQDEPRNKSFVGGFVRGLKSFPKRVLRTRNSTEKRRPGLITEEGDSTDAVTTLPRYKSNPSTPVVGPSTVTYVQATEMPMPELRERLPADALRSVRPRHPSYRVTGPSMYGLAEEQTAQIYDLPPDPPTFLESTGPPTPQLDPDRATTLFYDTPADGTSTNGQPQSQSLRISYISHHTPNTRPPTATPQHIPSQIPSEAQESPPSVQSPVLAHPPLSTDYRKMSLNSHDAASQTTYTSCCSLEPSFSSELSPVKRFLHLVQSLPWVSNERITSDYSPGRANALEKDLPKKPLISWYRRPGDRSSRHVDLLSTGSQGSHRALSNSSTATPGTSPKLEPRRVRRSHSHLQGQRHQRGHGRHQRHQRQHHHRHPHGRHRQRRRGTTTTAPEDEEMEGHMHKPSPVLPSVYPSQIAYAYQYPFPATAPRGPRSRHEPAYPGGYVPFQPMPSPPPPGQMGSPLYVVPANAHSQGSIVDGYPMHGQPMYVLTHNFHSNRAPGSPTPSNQGMETEISQNT